MEWLLPAENNIVRQLIYVCLPVVWKMIFQRGTDIDHNSCNRIGVMFSLKMGKNKHHFLSPEFFSHFFMYGLIAKNCQLTILHSNINQNGIVPHCFFHFQVSKYFRCPIQRIYKTATAFDKNPDFPAGLMFCFLDGRDDLFFFFFRKKILF